MNRISILSATLFATMILAGSCIPQGDAVPSFPAPIAAETAPAAPQPAPARPVAALPAPDADWRVWPRVDGDWMVEGNVAGLIDPARKSVFSIQCDADDDVISIVRHGVVADGKAVTIRTSFGQRTITGVRKADMEGAIIGIRLPRNDVLLDQIIYSRGYFGVETPGNQAVRIPAAPQIARVVEQCRS